MSPIETTSITYELRKLIHVKLTKNPRKLGFLLLTINFFQVQVRGNNSWYLNSGCSKHMTGDKSKFLSLEAYDGGTMTFGNNMKGEIIAKRKVGRSSSHAIDNVFLVENLKYNLLSISQFCDKGNSVNFTSEKCIISRNHTKDAVIEGIRKGNTYVVDLDTVPKSSLSVIEDDPLLWHKRLGHATYTLINSLRSKDLVRGLPSIKFLKDEICDPCAKRKQVRSSFKSKNVVTTYKLLELIHMDL